MHSTVAPNCRICPYRTSCLFYSLDEPSKKEWIPLRKARIYPQGSSIFLEGDEPRGVYVVCEGKVKISKTTRTGKALTTKILTPGSLFGHRSLLAQEAYSASTEAFADSVISRIDHNRFMAFLHRHWPTAMLILKQLARSVREGEDIAREVAYSTGKARLAKALLSHIKKAGDDLLVLTQRKELAQIAGIAVETCVRLIQKMEQSKVILRATRRKLVVLNKEALERIAGSALTTGQ